MKQYTHKNSGWSWQFCWTNWEQEPNNEKWFCFFFAYERQEFSNQCTV